MLGSGCRVDLVEEVVEAPEGHLSQVVREKTELRVAHRGEQHNSEGGMDCSRSLLIPKSFVCPNIRGHGVIYLPVFFPQPSEGRHDDGGVLLL